jgi:phosphate transport system ATP-binding protein
MRELQHNYTIVIVTHNMQQAVRASDYTAFFNIRKKESGHKETRWGELIEFNETAQMFRNTPKPDQRIIFTGRFG